jgi:hypothetical protein
MDLSQQVEEVFMSCLFKEEEVTEGKLPIYAILVEGIVHRLGFHPQRIELNKGKIKEFLNEMPKEFHKNGGGGWSFLNMYMDKHGVQWGEHRNIEQLVVLGIAAKMVKYCMPRDMWGILPGGMPYIAIDTEKEK